MGDRWGQFRLILDNYRPSADGRTIQNWLICSATITLSGLAITILTQGVGGAPCRKQTNPVYALNNDLKNT
jgi:hypothetical protein